MPSLFISHSSEDRPVAEALTRRLAAEGLRSYFLDVDPEQGIRVGRSWERELYTELRRADAVLYLSSASSDVSRWCFAELVDVDTILGWAAQRVTRELTNAERQQFGLLDETEHRA